MKLIRFVLLCIFSVCFADPNHGPEIGYTSYVSTNIGDDIQAIAARRFLPKNCVPIDREFISEFKHSSVIPAIVSGWFMHVNRDVILHTFHKQSPVASWPPSPYIDPFFISMHLTTPAVKELLTPEGIEYFKQHAPIGARDYFTLREFEKRGIPAYFSGCLTLTLDNPLKGNRRDVIYAVDIPKECVNYIRSRTRSRVIEISHGVPAEIGTNHEERLRYAESLLNMYRTAKCVITARLHVAMPCLAFETPVLLFGGAGGRFDGLGNLARRCSTQQEFLNGEIDFDFDHPPENPKDYLEIRESLIQIVEDWVKSKS